MDIRSKDGLWVNSNVFCEAAQHFSKYKRYCDYDWSSSEGYDFWQSELEKTINGVEIGGARITGDHYFYLNYTQMMRVHPGESVKRKGFPAFYDGDHDYFWNFEISRFGCTEKFMKSLRLINEPGVLTGGQNMIIAKARRKGFSYKNAAIATNCYNNTPEASVLLAAYDSKYLYPKGTMAMCSNIMNHLNEHTGWFKLREFIDKVSHKKASYKEVDPVLKRVYEKGYKSEIMALTFKDNEDPGRGTDNTLIMVEEGGAWPGLRGTIPILQPTQEDGIHKTGMMVIYGTGGDMSAGSIDFADMFYNPELEDFNHYENVWDEGATSRCGYYFPDNMCFPGFIDPQGNSDLVGAKKYELGKRKKLLEAGKKSLYEKRTIEHSLCPSESFLVIGSNPFNVALLKKQYEKVVNNKLFEKDSVFIRTFYDGEKYGYDVVLDGSVEPVLSYPIKEKDLTGCPVMFEPPDPFAPPGTYVAGYDPYYQDESFYSPSVGAFYIYKKNLGRGGPAIVCSYVGRGETTEHVHKQCLELLEIYNAKMMHENMVKDVNTYFSRRRKYHLLFEQPDDVINLTTKDSKVSRKYGSHMTKEIRAACEKYYASWLEEVRDHDEEGNEILNVHTIKDPGLLKESIYYKKDGNFDRIFAMFMIMLACQEDEITEYKATTQSIIDEINSFFGGEIQ